MTYEQPLQNQFNLINDLGIATNDEINLVTCIDEWNEDTANNIVYARTGYNSLSDYIESELNDSEIEFYKDIYGEQMF